MERINTVLTLLGIAILILLGLYFVSNHATKLREDESKWIASGTVYSKGIITDMHFYKGKSISVKYQVDNKQYNYTGGWDKNPDNLDVGDSIKFKYSINKPSIIVVELRSEYKETH